MMEEPPTGHHKFKNEVKMSDNTLKLHDSSIVQIAKLVQIAILTGTDVVDNLRTLSFCIDDDTKTLVPDESYIETFKSNLQSMQDELIENSE